MLENELRTYKGEERAGNQTPLRESDLMIVLTGGEMSYKKEDEVYNIPLLCLRN